MTHDPQEHPDLYADRMQEHLEAGGDETDSYYQYLEHARSASDTLAMYAPDDNDLDSEVTL